MNSELLLDSLQVKGFRAFEDLQIPKLGRVNLITGKNNVGKTCLLEALQVYARRGAPNVLQSLLVRRDETYVSGNMKPQEVSRYLDNMRHVFYGRPDSDEQCRLEVGSLTNSKCRVSVHFEEIDFQEEENVDDLRKILSGSAWTRHSMASKGILETSEPFLIVTVGEQRHVIPFSPQSFRSPFAAELAEQAIKHTFVWAKGLDNTLLANWWDNVALTPFEDDVTRALKLVAPTVSAVTFVNRSTREGNPERVPVVRVATRDFPIPMKSLGEGVNRMFGLALALASSKDGFLMVDEIETGLHYSVQADMWRLVFKTARDLNVQVFATTHSSDCIRAFEQAAREDKEAKGVLIRLENKNGKVRAVPFDEEDLEIAVSEGIEVR